MKKMVLLMAMVLSVYAAEVNWFTSYKEAAVAAKAQEKPMLLFMNKPGCGSCAYMKENVFSDEKIIAYLNTHYVAVSLDTKSNDAPEQFQVAVTPVFHFVRHDGSIIKNTLTGGKTAPFFLKLLGIAKDAY